MYSKFGNFQKIKKRQDYRAIMHYCGERKFRLYI